MSPATAAITQMLRVMMRHFIEDYNLLDEEDSDDDEDADGATISTGGSSGASQRSSRTRYDYDLASKPLKNPCELQY